MLISLATFSCRQTRPVLLETRNRLHIYSRACCTSCGPRYQPLSRAPFTLRGIRLIHPPSFELACCRSDLFKASSTSRLTRNGQEKLRHRHQRWCGHGRWQWNAADVVRVIPLLSRHDRPQDPRVLVGQGDHGLLPASTLSQLLSPQEDWVVVLACQRNGLSALNEQGSQVYASTLGDTAQTGLSATGVLLGCQTQPSSELSSVSELSEVTHRGHECRCSDRADAHQLGGTLDLFIVFLVIGNALIAPLDVRIQLAPVLLRSLQNKASNAGNVIAGIFNDVAQMAAQHFRALRQHDPELCQQAANAVDTGGPFFLESFPQPVYAEHALLRQCFGWYEVHVRPSTGTHSSCDRPRLHGSHHAPAIAETPCRLASHSIPRHSSPS